MIWLQPSKNAFVLAEPKLNWWGFLFKPKCNGENMEKIVEDPMPRKNEGRSLEDSSKLPTHRRSTPNIINSNKV